MERNSILSLSGAEDDSLEIFLQLFCSGCPRIDPLCFNSLGIDPLLFFSGKCAETRSSSRETPKQPNAARKQPLFTLEKPPKPSSNFLDLFLTTNTPIITNFTQKSRPLSTR